MSWEELEITTKKEEIKKFSKKEPDLKYIIGCLRRSENLLRSVKAVRDTP